MIYIYIRTSCLEIGARAQQRRPDRRVAGQGDKPRCGASVQCLQVVPEPGALREGATLITSRSSPSSGHFCRAHHGAPAVWVHTALIRSRLRAGGVTSKADKGARLGLPHQQLVVKPCCTVSCWPVLPRGFLDAVCSGRDGRACCTRSRAGACCCSRGCWCARGLLHGAFASRTRASALPVLASVDTCSCGRLRQLISCVAAMQTVLCHAAMHCC